jgi:hypothetical protein
MTTKIWPGRVRNNYYQLYPLYGHARGGLGTLGSGFLPRRCVSLFPGYSAPIGIR